MRNKICRVNILSGYSFILFDQIRKLTLRVSKWFIQDQHLAYPDGFTQDHQPWLACDMNQSLSILTPMHFSPIYLYTLLCIKTHQWRMSLRFRRSTLQEKWMEVHSLRQYFAALNRIPQRENCPFCLEQACIKKSLSSYMFWLNL